LLGRKFVGIDLYKENVDMATSNIIRGHSLQSNAIRSALNGQH
jgi:hypothetical protein